jgi:hypothetical protein
MGLGSLFDSWGSLYYSLEMVGSVKFKKIGGISGEMGPSVLRMGVGDGVLKQL